MAPRPARRSPTVTAAQLIATALVVAGCGLVRGSPAVVTPSRAAGAQTTAPRGALGLLVEPGSGLGALDRLVAAARRSVDVAVYELADPSFERLLASDAATGIRVRVLLDRRRERRRNQPAFSWLRAHGVDVAWATAAFDAVHEKLVVVDRATVVIMTLNLVAADLPDTRDLAVIDRRRADVSAVEAVVDADLAGRVVVPARGDDLVWSPGAAPALVTLIRSARRSVSLESEEMTDWPVVDALAADARRGVPVRVALPGGWGDDDRRQLAALTSAGVSVTVRAQGAGPYLHAKAIVVDDTTAFVGSQNASYASLDDNRELGLITTDRRLVARLVGVLRADRRGARR